MTSSTAEITYVQFMQIAHCIEKHCYVAVELFCRWRYRRCVTFTFGLWLVYQKVCI